MDHTTDAVRWPRLFVVLAAALGLALATMPAALAQDEDDEDDGAITCDADSFDLDGDVVYFVEPGQEVACEASELEPEEEAEWEVAFFDLAEDTDEPVEVVGGFEEATEDGTLVVEFVVPGGILFGFFEGFVAQGEDDEYFQDFFGLILGFGPIVCDPDPVTQGENVECVAEEMVEGEFEWAATFLTADQFLALVEAEDEDEIFDEILAPAVEGTASADTDGVGVFDFDVPLEGEFEVYLAMAFQEDSAYFAFYVGDVLPAEEPALEDEEEDAPVVVARPERVETGGGGSAPGADLPAGLLLVVVALAAAATIQGVRHDVMRRR